MYQTIKDLLLKEGIDQVGCIPFSEADIYNARLIPDGVKSIVLFLIPYDTGERFDDGVSAYAHIPDYHAYFSGLKDRLLEQLSAAFPEQKFWAFADHSPIGEKSACAKAGLGVVGKNTILINRKYGSFVFIGAVYTDAVLPYAVSEIKPCPGCGKCVLHCPGKCISDDSFLADNCFSMLSQKKKLSEEEMQMLVKEHISWGCDRCQDVCPLNEKRAFTPIPFFLEQTHGSFTAAEVEAMDDETFASYAFSWRGRNRITENLRNLERHSEK